MGQLILTIDTQSPEDRKYVAAIARILTELYPDNPPRAVSLEDPPLSQEQSAKLQASIREDVAAMVTPPPEPGPILSPKQAQAAKARQAKADKAAAAAAAAEAAERARAVADAQTLEAERIVGNGHDGDFFEEAEAEPSTSLSPAEALDAGVALIRRVYQAGHTDAVRDITKQWGVVKFREIPVEKGHDFHREVMALADRLGVR